MNEEFIIENYPLNSIKHMEKITIGRSSEVYKVVSSKQTIALHQHHSETEVDLEILLHKHFESTFPKVIPSIIETKNLENYVIAADRSVLYAQEWVDGKNPLVNNKDSIKKVALSIGYWSRHLENFYVDKVNADRFDLMEMYEKIQCNHKIGTCLENNGLNKACLFELNQKTNEKEQYIHGDLGKWNMIEREHDCIIIDFGEFRKGSHYFDFAASLVSCISLKPLNITERKELISLFIIQLEKSLNKEIDTNILCFYIELWIVRGILAVCLYNKDFKKIEAFIKDEISELDAFKAFFAIAKN